MKSIDPRKIEGFVRTIGDTREHEYDCSECRQHVGEFAEKMLAGLPVDEALSPVEHHLALCPECREEFVALEQILRASE